MKRDGFEIVGSVVRILDSVQNSVTPELVSELLKQLDRACELTGNNQKVLALRDHVRRILRQCHE
ncbi:MAG: hypothetical protein KBE65_08445 [Phycisphaerae bacterium]|nr:hypothetical protein [Phycisphaerae bacterium]